MRILFVANRMPYPPYRGDKLKIFNLMGELINKHEIHLLTIAENQQDLDSIQPLLQPLGNGSKIIARIDYIYRPIWVSAFYTLMGAFSRKPFQIAFFQSNKFRKKLKNLLDTQQYDAIHVQHIRMAQYFEGIDKTNVILDLPDAFSMYWQRRKDKSRHILQKFFAAVEFKRLYQFEQKMIPQFAKTLVCSTVDQSFLMESTGVRVDLLENGVDVNQFYPRPEIEFVPGRILFTGNMSYAPNIDALHYFIEEIWPIVIQNFPDATFVIAGQKPGNWIQSLASDKITVTGFVQDLAKEYASAHVVISPLRIGAGTQNKVLEALSMNIPVVTTHVGYEGLELPKNAGALLSMDASEFANNILKLLNDIPFRNETGKMGGELIRAKFSWEAIAKKLEAYLMDVQKGQG
jgi:sugar transferase (PEP-CTERM/EpsH1 system associated)